MLRLVRPLVRVAQRDITQPPRQVRVARVARRDIIRQLLEVQVARVVRGDITQRLLARLLHVLQFAQLVCTQLLEQHPVQLARRVSFQRLAAVQAAQVAMPVHTCRQLYSLSNRACALLLALLYIRRITHQIITTKIPVLSKYLLPAPFLRLRSILKRVMILS